MYLWSFVVVLVLGCSGAAPTALPAPTVDVSATVEAAVEATRAVDRSVSATSEARAAVLAATPVPTATSVVMTLLVPTPEPFVVAPGDIEESVGKLYRCVQEDEVIRSGFLAAVGAELAESGLSPKEVDSLVEEFLGDREAFIDLYISLAEEDPGQAVMLVALAEMLDDLCTDSSSSHRVFEEAFTYWVIDYDTGVAALNAELRYLEAEIEELDREEDIGLEDAKSSSNYHVKYVSELAYEASYRALIGELFDCYHSNQYVGELMDSYAHSTFAIFRPYPFSSDRRGTMMVLRAFARQDPDSADRFDDLYLALDAMCR